MKTLVKYIPKDQVHKSELKLNQISDSPISISERSSSNLHFQSFVDSIKGYFQAQTGVDLIENLSKFGGEITQFSSEPKIHVASPSSQSIVNEVSSFVEEKSKISSSVQRHIHPKTSTFTEEKLEKVLEIAPFLDKTILIEEDIGYILQVFSEKSRLFFISAVQIRSCSFSSRFYCGIALFFSVQRNII